MKRYVGPTKLRTGLVLIFAVWILASAVANEAVADIYQCEDLDGDGVISLSNVGQTSRCKKMVLQPKPKNPPSFTPLTIPLDSTEVSNRALPDRVEAIGERRKILNDELELERQRLRDISARITELKNAAESKDRQRAILSAQQKEALHRSNIKLLEHELNQN